MIVSVLRKLRSIWYRLSAIKYRSIAIYQVWLAGGKLSFGDHVKLATPVRVDGSGVVNIGHNCSLGFKLAIRVGNGEILVQARNPGSVVEIGDRCSLSNNISIIARTRIELGSCCIVGDRVTILDADFHEINPDVRIKHGGPGKTEPVRIGQNCWIGTDAMILKGVSIGGDSIIAPKSVVTRSFPTRSMIAGSPAKLVKSFGT